MQNRRILPVEITGAPILLKFTEYDDCLRAFWHNSHHENERLKLSDSDTAQLCFNGQVKGEIILVVEGLPAIIIKQNGAALFDETVKSVDDLKIFLEERLYKYLEV